MPEYIWYQWYEWLINHIPESMKKTGTLHKTKNFETFLIVRSRMPFKIDMLSSRVRRIRSHQ